MNLLLEDKYKGKDYWMSAYLEGQTLLIKNLRDPEASL
jgi:hypothetical protein